MVNFSGWDCRGGFMLEIANITITFVQTRPYQRLTFRSPNVSATVKFPIGLMKNSQVAGGVGQVCTKVNFRFELVA